MEMYEDEVGPPTQEDDWWHHEHVRAAGYPKVQRGDKPMEGQMVIPTTVNHPNQHLAFMSGGSCWCGTRHNQEETDALNT